MRSFDTAASRFQFGHTNWKMVFDAARPEGFPDPSVPPASRKRFEEILTRSGL